jgi:hypothetical protein
MSKYSESSKGKARTKRYKDKNRNKITAQNRALYVHNEKQLCSIKGCEDVGHRHHEDYEKAEDIIWLCRKHHLEIHGKIRGTCTKCDRPHVAKGLCKNHYAQKYRKEQGW